MQQSTVPMQQMFRQRRKGQRYEVKSYPVDNIALFEGSAGVVIVSQHGTFEDIDGYGPGTCTFEYLAVQFEGRLWPCYRKFEPGRNFAICHLYQMYSHPIA